MLNRQHRRQLRAWLAKRHDPRPSWLAHRADAETNDGTIPPLEEAQRILRAIKAATGRVLAASGGLGIDADPMNLCAVLAAVAARVATEQTGNAYRVQSGRWSRVLDLGPGGVRFYERTGSGADFHTWAIAAHPGGRVALLDAQAMWWEPETVVWDWAEEELRRGVAWRAHTATTARVMALAAEHVEVVEAIYRETTAALERRQGATP